MRCGGKKYQMAIAVVCQSFQKLVSLMAVFTSALNTTVGFIDDYELGAGTLKLVSASIGLDEVERYYSERMFLKNRSTRWESPRSSICAQWFLLMRRQIPVSMTSVGI